MRTYSAGLRITSSVTLAFFLWSFLPLYSAVAYAAEPQGQGASSKGPGNQVAADLSPRESSGERFEKALESIRENVGKADEKAGRGEAATEEVAEIKKQRSEIESADSELKKEFAATEKKLKDANLPKEILDRHAKFVKHYEDNLKELKTNLDSIDKPSAKSNELRAALQKAKAHLEKTKAPSRHVPLDPNNLQNRMVKGKERAPRLKKEDFEKDFPAQKSRGKGHVASSKGLGAWGQELVAADFSLRERSKQKPILVASNGSLAGLLSSDSNLPRPLRERTEVRGGLNPISFAVNDFTPQSAFATPQWNTPNSTL